MNIEFNRNMNIMYRYAVISIVLFCIFFLSTQNSIAKTLHADLKTDLKVDVDKIANNIKENKTEADGFSVNNYVTNADGSTDVSKIDLSKVAWKTNNDAPIFADSRAKRGGMFRAFIPDFPVTFRNVGPNSNNGFREYINASKLSLIDIHPQTLEVIPYLASSWAIMPDNQTVLYKLNMHAKWSDGYPVTADDYVFMLEFMRSKYIVAPWYNDYYTKEIVEVSKLSEDVISVKSGNKKPIEDLLFATNIIPVPKHFHKLDKDWVSWANWRVEPVTGAYVIDTFKKGSYIEFRRIDDWWGNNERYLANRFNFDRVRFKVVRNMNIAWNMFMKGEFDSFPLVLPEYWYDRAKSLENNKFSKGYINKYWFYNDVARPSAGLYLNMDFALFKDKKVRYAISYALNIDGMNKSLLRGDYDRLPNPYTGYGKYTDENIKARPFDIEKANELLKEAGWVSKNSNGVRIKNGETLSFKVSYSSEEHTPRLAFLREEAMKAGIDMQLQLLKGASGYRNIMEKKHEAAWMAWGTGFRPQYWEMFDSENAHTPQTNNITNTDDKQMDQMILSYRTAITANDRVDLSKQIQQKIYDIGAIIPTYMVPYTREAGWAYVRVPESLPKTTDSIFNPMILGLIWYDSDIKSKIENGEKIAPINFKDETYRIKPVDE